MIIRTNVLIFKILVNKHKFKIVHFQEKVNVQLLIINVLILIVMCIKIKVVLIL